MEQLEDLDIADDIVLVSTTINQRQRKTTTLADTASKIGLRISRKKTKGQLQRKGEEQVSRWRGDQGGERLCIPGCNSE